MCTMGHTLNWMNQDVQSGPKKTGLFLKVDNFATVSDRNACDMSKFSQFYLEKEFKTCMSVR